MFIAERDVQPDASSSIPAAMWWSIVTLTLVGYGDIYPVSMPVRLLGAVIAVMGIGSFAPPAGLLACGVPRQLPGGGRRQEPVHIVGG